MAGIDLSPTARALPAWVTEPTFVAASLGALALVGHAAGAAQYGIAGMHLYWMVYLYWIGAVPAVILLGLLVLPPEPRER
jgi:hypothetical protein